MKMTDIQVGAEYAVGGRNHIRRAVVLEKSNYERYSPVLNREVSGPAVKVIYDDGAQGFLIAPLVLHPWSVQQAVSRATAAEDDLRQAKAEEVFSVLSKYAERQGVVASVEAHVDDAGDIVIQLSPALGDELVALLLEILTPAPESPPPKTRPPRAAEK